MDTFESMQRQRERIVRQPTSFVGLELSGASFERMQSFWWQGEDKTVNLTVAGTEHDIGSHIDDPGFTETEPHVWVDVHQVADDGSIVTSRYDGKLLADIEEHPEIPFSDRVHKPPLRPGVKPKVFIPGDWAGYDHGYNDITVELPAIDAGTLVIPKYEE
jgi:hypothetical protein